MLEKLIFMCIYPPDLDGSGYSNSEFIQGLSKRGYVIEVVAQPCKGDKEYDEWSEKTHNVRIHRVPMHIPYEGNPPSGNQLEAVGEFISKTFRERMGNGGAPDMVVLGHDSWAWYQPLVHKVELPVVQHLRGTPTRSIMDGIYPPEETEEYLACVLGADHIVPIAKHFEDLMVSLGYPQERITTVHNGIDTSLFYPKDNGFFGLQAELEIPRDSKVIVHASNFCPVKRVGDIVASANEVLNERDDVIYLLIGEGPETESVRESIMRSPYKSHFRMPGKIPHKQMPDYLRLGKIFIISSESEGFTRASLEAHACGLHLIMSDMPAGIERTRNGTMGTNYEMGNPYDLAAKTLDVLDMDQEKFLEIQKKGITYIRNECSFETQLDKYEAVLNRVYNMHAAKKQERIKPGIMPVLQDVQI